MQSGLTLWKSSVPAAYGSSQERSCVLSKKFLLSIFVVLLVSGSALAQSLTPLKNQPPDGIIYTFQLTDGTVMAQGGNCSDWWQLTPDNTGSYVNGTWKQLANLPSGYAPYATSSAVLADGRLLLEGGEYSDCGGAFTLTNQGAIYDPVANTWTTVAPPKGWTNIGDSPSTVLADGNYLIGNKLTKQMRLLNPTTMKWSTVSSKGKKDFFAEEGLTLLASGSVLTADVKDAPNSEIYDATAAKPQVGDRRKHDRRPAFAVAGWLPSVSSQEQVLLPAWGNWASDPSSRRHRFRHRILYQERWRWKYGHLRQP